MKCESCGAQISEYEANCRFCGAVTPYGHHQQQHQAHLEALEKHHELHGQTQRLAQVERALRRTSNFSLYWGGGGLLLCLCLVPSVVALMLGLRGEAACLGLAR